jgi:hypothetical protein
LIAACTSTPEEAPVFDAGRTEDPSVARLETSPGRSGAPAEARRLLIRTGSMAVEVSDLESAVEALSAMVRERNGYTLNASTSSEWARVSAKVPAADLEAFLDQVATLGEERSRQINADDVTERFHDLQAEIENTRAFRDRLRLLLERAEKVEEVLNVERELTRVQTHLDSLESRSARMSTDIEYATVSIDFSMETAPRVLGPLGLLFEGTWWLVTKLFVISP